MFRLGFPFTLLLALVLSPARAQRPATDDEKIPKSRMQQHEDFKAQRSAFPARPRNMWEVGISGGIVQISGDVKTNWTGRGKDHLPAFGYGVTVRKALGYVMSLRGEYFRGQAYGQNWQPSSGIDNNPALNGFRDPATDYADSPGYIFHNYKTTINDASVEALFTLNNIRYHKERNRVGLNAIIGLGIGTYETSYDQLDAAGNRYDYAPIQDLGGSTFDDRDLILDALDGFYDSAYETPAEGHTDDPSLFDRQYKPVVTVGAGVHILLGNRVSLALEHKVKLTNDDLLDGQRWEETNTLTRSFDTYHYSSLHLNFHLGRKGKTEIPPWWVNPVTFTYGELADNVPPDMSDDDGDGVLNILDQEPGTHPDCPVDTRGVTLDSDKDGCPDCEDPEPFSTPERAIRDCINVGPSTELDEPAVRRIVQEMLGEQGISAAGSDWYLPMIHFDLNGWDIKTDYFPDLQHVAEVMKRYPDLQVEVVGHADVRADEDYNLNLSQRRAQAAIDHLVKRYGIDTGRFILKYEGEGETLVPLARRETDHYMNRRVEFRAVVE